MPIDAPYAPSPVDWVAEQVELYESTGGREGRVRAGAPCVILTTLGRRSGTARKSPLIRVERDGCYAALGSMGGAPKDPSWVDNLRAHPLATLQDGGEVRDYRAREVDGEERDQWWAVATAVWPDYDEYQSRTERRIPVMVLEPV